MDLLIKHANAETRLSQLGLYNIRIDDSTPSIEVDRRAVKGRNGYIHDGIVLRQKKIKISGRLAATDLPDLLDKQDTLAGWLYGDEPYYITKMYPSNGSLYGFELPGKTSGDLDLLGVVHTTWKYRYMVHIAGEIEYSFLGTSSAGIKYDVSFEMTTAELPYGETVPRDITLSGGSISYAGTAQLSQLELPLVVEMTSNASQTSFFLEIDGRRWTYNHTQTPIAAGDKLLISGVDNRIYKGQSLPDLNINARTNLEYFIIKPNPQKQVRYSTNFRGTIKILGFKELYK